ncbi:hypothetical protein FSP39_001193 [Pinctada imbricata]|uniref:BED-type domain-containing protein n=1 Tax=Pinctada imbricata TaxID=66713 RepID=A0AA88YD80_PINIB|nr:hypothetical protein FSP39_001193 [Pinctada imbricata]
MEENLPTIYSYPGKFKSDVWHDFGFYMGEDGMLDKSHAICRVCHHGVRYLGNTTNLRSHLAKHKRHGDGVMPEGSVLQTPPGDMTFQREIGQDSPIINDQDVVSSVQLSIKSVFSRSNRGDMLNLMVGEYLIENVLPPSVVDTQSFVSLLGVADPNFRVQPSTYYTSILFNELYERQRAILSELLVNRDITLSIETWENINARSYVTYIANIITDSWKFETYTLSSMPMTDDFHGQISNLCETFGFQLDNIVTIGHCVQAHPAAGIFINCLGKAIDETVSHILAFGDVPGVVESVKTLGAIDTEVEVVKMADYVKMLDALNKKPKSSTRGVNMQSVEAVMNALKPLKSAAEHMLDQEEVIVSAVLPIMRKLELSLGSKDGDCQLEKELKSEAWCFLKKYYEDNDVKDFLLISSLLDPRFKELLFVDVADLKRAQSQLLCVTAEMFKSMQCDLGSGKRHADSSAHVAMPDLLFGESPIKKIKTEFDEATSDPVQLASTSKTNGNWLSDVVNKKTEVTKEESMESLQAEIDRYMTLEQTTSQPLLWWKSRQSVYPILSKVARRYLCTPATSLPPEAIFKRQYKELNDRRRLIPDDLVDKMVFLNRNYNRLKE